MSKEEKELNEWKFHGIEAKANVRDSIGGWFVTCARNSMLLV
jgi:hypothetical protein